MTTVHRAACGLAMLIAYTGAHAFTASELVAKNVEAKGGAGALKAVQSVRRAGRMIVDGGQFVLDVAETRQRPESIRFEASLQGLTQVQAYDGRQGWKIDPFGGRKDPELMPAEDVKEMIEDASIDGALVDAASRGGKVEYLGTENVDGTEAHKLKATQQDGSVQYVFLDPEYFLEIRIESQRTVRGVKRTTMTELGNYEKVGGVFWPLSVETGVKGRGDPVKFEYDVAEVNVDIGPDYFSFPVATNK